MRHMVRELQDSAGVRLTDALVLAWCALWLVLGVWVGWQIWQLSQLGAVLADAGLGLDDSGRALQELRDLPVIGDTPGTIGDEVRQTALEVVEQGRQTQASTRRLAVLLGLTTALLPALPALLYAVGRHRASRERRALVKAAQALDPEDLQTHLARQALQHLPYVRLLEVTDTPERDFREGRTAGLADAELARLGLRRNPT